MSSAHAFNSLGQILATGGEILVAKQILAGKSLDAILPIFINRYRPESSDSFAAVVGIANQGILAAAAHNRMGLSDKIDIGLLPVNPYLFGDDSGGLRGLVIGSVLGSQSGDPYVIHGQIVDWQQVVDLFQSIDSVIETLQQPYTLSLTAAKDLTNYFPIPQLMFMETRF